MILEHAASLASQLGLEGLTIGRLAGDLDLSKSGLFSHFQSKEQLQLQVLEFAAQRFVDCVVRPALQAARGEPRIRALFERWLRWPAESGLPGGCLFVALSAELDDRPGALRDRFVQLQKDWFEVLSNSARTAVAEGHFRQDLDPEQFAHDLYGAMLVGHHAARLLGDPKAARRTRTAFETLLVNARETH